MLHDFIHNLIALLMIKNLFRAIKNLVTLNIKKIERSEPIRARAARKQKSSWEGTLREPLGYSDCNRVSSHFDVMIPCFKYSTQKERFLELKMDELIFGYPTTGSSHCFFQQPDLIANFGKHCDVWPLFGNLL